MTNRNAIQLLAPAAAIGIGILSVLQLRAQSVPADSQAFDVASIKLNKSGDKRQTWQFYDGGRYSATNTPLRWLIRVAYDIPFDSAHLSGGPDWLDSDRYDVEAKAAAGAVPADLSTKVRDDRIRLMLQVLLADRFKLVLRRESNERSVYGPVVTKNASKLHNSKTEEKDCPTITSTSVICHRFSGGPGRGLKGEAVSMVDLAQVLSAFVDRPVLDKSGIKGLFDLKLDPWMPIAPIADGTDGNPAHPPLPTIFTAIEEQLGLKLIQQKDTVDSFVVSYAEKPSE